MYPASVKNLESIMSEALREGAEFVLHAGDFCNDYLNSREIVRAYLDNAEGLSVFGCYGNHELESKDNSMASVTELLSNRTEKNVYGTADGKIGDGSVGYYYTDKEGYRLIFLDTNYSLSPDGIFEHNKTASWGKPRENTRPDSLGDVQLSWLESVIDDAVERGLICITVSHASFSGLRTSSPDADRVREIFKAANAKREGSVLLAINGHYHTCNTDTVEGVVYFDCPAVINGLWKSERFYPYAEENAEDPKFTFEFCDYDSEGALTSVSLMPYSKLSMGAQSLFYDRPVFAFVTVDGKNTPKIDIRERKFAYGIAPK